MYIQSRKKGDKQTWTEKKSVIKTWSRSSIIIQIL